MRIFWSRIMLRPFRILTLFIITLTAGFTAGICIGGTANGPQMLSLEGGRTGNVPFPHHRHQAVLNDCNVCHDLFPQERGAIEALKAKGELKKKHVMSKHCIKCHRKMKKSGDKTGPTSCRTCHIKQ